VSLDTLDLLAHLLTLCLLQLSKLAIMDKKVGVNQPKRLENAKILVANTAMDTDKVKILASCR
jgi:hypothetical protein